MLLPAVEVEITATSTRQTRRCLSPRNDWSPALLVNNVLVVEAVALTLMLVVVVLLIIDVTNSSSLSLSLYHCLVGMGDKLK